MKTLLLSVVDLQQRYVELAEYKKSSCLPVEKLVPDLKNITSEDEETLTEAQLEQLKIHQRKKRRYKHSFINQYNLIELSDDELNGDYTNYKGTTLSFFETRLKETQNSILTHL